MAARPSESPERSIDLPIGARGLSGSEPQAEDRDARARSRGIGGDGPRLPPSATGLRARRGSARPRAAPLDTVELARSARTQGPDPSGAELVRRTPARDRAD